MKKGKITKIKNNKQLIKLIKQARLDSPITQLHMSEYLGISQATYSRIESGKITITTINLIKIFKILYIDMFICVNTGIDA